MRGGGGGGGRKIHRRVDHAMCARLWLDTIRSSSGRYPTVQTRKPEEQRDKHDVTQRKDKIFSIKNRKEGRKEGKSFRLIASVYTRSTVSPII